MRKFGKTTLLEREKNAKKRKNNKYSIKYFLCRN